MTNSSSGPATRPAELALDHEHLEVIVQRLANLCEALESGRSRADPTPVIAELELCLWRHFTAEEADDYFGAISRQQPMLLANIKELKAEHAAMFRAVSALRTLAADKARRLDVPASARSFVAELRHHEDKENRLLQEFVLRDEGAVQD